MKTLMRFLCVALLLAIPAVSQSDSDRYDARDPDHGWSVTGKVIAVDRGDGVLEIFDSSHEHYTILAEDARIYEGNRERRFRDIDRNDVVRIYGRLRDEHFVEARVIYKLDRDDDSRDEHRGSIRLFGTIKKVYSDRIDLAVNGRTQKVRITRETEIYSARNRRVGVDHLRKGDAVRVEGYSSRRNEVVAAAIYAGDGYDWEATRRGRTIEARVVRDTTFFDRKLRVVPVGRNERLSDMFEVEVPRDAEVIKHGRRISVHEIRTGDVIYAEGSWGGYAFMATRVLVNESDAWRDYDRSRDYRTFQGRIEKIDHREHWFILDTGAGERKVYADRARIWHDGRVCDFDDLRRGDDVRVRGNADGMSVDAERVELVRGGYRRD